MFDSGGSCILDKLRLALLDLADSARNLRISMSRMLVALCLPLVETPSVRSYISRGGSTVRWSWV